MLHFARPIALMAAALCAIAALPAGAGNPPVEVEPVLRFDVIEVPDAGRVSTVTGNVERLARADGWVAVKPGYRLLHGDQFKISAGGTLIIMFSGKERAEFHAATQDRWVRFEVAGRSGHDT